MRSTRSSARGAAPGFFFANPRGGTLRAHWCYRRLGLNDRFALGSARRCSTLLNRMRAHHVPRQQERGAARRHRGKTSLKAVSDRTSPSRGSGCRDGSAGRASDASSSCPRTATGPLERRTSGPGLHARAAPREAGRGCRQRGQHYAARFFDGYGWCDNKNARIRLPLRHREIGFLEAGKKIVRPGRGERQACRRGAALGLARGRRGGGRRGERRVGRFRAPPPSTCSRARSTRPTREKYNHYVLVR